MQPLAATANANSDCYLQIRRGKQTIFTDVAETNTLADLKQIIAHILKINPETIRVKSKGQLLDIDGKHLLEYGITTREARPQTPFQLELLLQLDDGSTESDEIIPYTTENQVAANEQHNGGGPSEPR